MIYIEWTIFKKDYKFFNWNGKSKVSKTRDSVIDIRIKSIYCFMKQKPIKVGNLLLILKKHLNVLSFKISLQYIVKQNKKIVMKFKSLIFFSIFIDFRFSLFKFVCTQVYTYLEIGNFKLQYFTLIINNICTQLRTLKEWQTI